MMRLLLFILIAICFNSHAQQLETFRVNVMIEDGMKEGKAYLRYFTDSGPYIDSVVFSDGKFTFDGRLPLKQTIARIFVRKSNEQDFDPGNSCELWIDTGDINILASNKLSHANYSGSVVQEQFSELQEVLFPVRKKNLELDEAYEKAEAKKDADAKDKLLNEEYPALFREKQKILGAFIRKYPASPISAFKLSEFAGDGEMDLSVVIPVYDLLDSMLKKHSLVMKVADRISINKRTAPGMPAIDFTQTDTAGRKVSLSSFRGKYVLIDFWAGWCVPCRAENPFLVRLYGQYREQGFEILGVSLDGERKRWTNAIVADGLKWTQVSDLKIFENEIAWIYGITSIPQNILVDPQGIIVAKNLRGKLLQAKLAQIFK